MADDTKWVEDVAQGEVVRFERTTAGRSRATWLVDVRRADGGVAEFVLRRDTGDGPLSGTELSLERESHVYAALANTAVPVPRLVGVSPDRLALLVERVRGTEDLAGAGAERDAVLASFVDGVATLHSIDVTTLDLPGFARPSTPEDHARTDLALWRRVFDGAVTRPAPLVHLVFRWLDEHAPDAVERTVLCHGDCGPGNFLHADGRVTALLDWEFAHLGDPMDDLAWISVRASQVAGMSDITSLVERYATRTGSKVDPDRVRYYQLMVLLRMAVACLVALDRRKGAMDASTYFALLPLLERQMVNLLAEQLGVELGPTALPASGGGTSRAEVIDAVGADIGNVYGPELQTPAARARVLGTSLLLSHLAAADTLGPAVDRAELDELATVTGVAATTMVDGRRALAALVEHASAEQLPELVAYFSRHADRQVALWPVLAGIASRPLPTVAAP